MLFRKDLRFTGQIDIPAVIRAARHAGIKHYYLEDESVSAVEQVPLNIKYLIT